MLYFLQIYVRLISLKSIKNLFGYKVFLYLLIKNRYTPFFTEFLLFHDNRGIAYNCVHISGNIPAV